MIPPGRDPDSCAIGAMRSLASLRGKPRGMLALAGFLASLGLSGHPLGLPVLPPISLGLGTVVFVETFVCPALACLAAYRLWISSSGVKVTVKSFIMAQVVMMVGCVDVAYFSDEFLDLTPSTHYESLWRLDLGLVAGTAGTFDPEWSAFRVASPPTNALMHL
ncbi:hypothetical protein NE237_008488 [Protea cynaroides]|uniref:Uncharacterized protein n=1 Tax=Protea cynaroides TaxID=273540 RepID=A0A9Q0KVM9_9MAGN|nr:hypothetical protein NE237_008488 [Protea cynaroides]